MKPRFRAEWVVVSEELLILASCISVMLQIVVEVVGLLCMTLMGSFVRSVD